MKMEITVAEAMDIINGIREERQNLLAMIRENVQETVGNYLSLLMDKELSHFPGRDRHIHCHEDVNHRNGSYHRKFTLKGIGEIDLKVPRDRNGLFSTQIIPRSKQYEDVLRENLSGMCLAGVSTRTLSMMSERFIGRRLSAGAISNVSKELTGAVEAWRERDLSKKPIKYLYIDGTNFSMRIDGTVEKVPVLVVVGVTTEGYRTVVGLQAGDKESAPNWREMFKDLKRRGLDGGTIALGSMDGLSALERVFKEEFPYAKTRRCQVHVARNVLAKVPQKLKKQIGDEVRSMFYASSKATARVRPPLVQAKPASWTDFAGGI